MSDATCKTCPWWSSPESECRSHAPSPSSSHEASDGWPTTDQDDWCGEHPDRQPRELA